MVSWRVLTGGLASEIGDGNAAQANFDATLYETHGKSGYGMGDGGPKDPPSKTKPTEPVQDNTRTNMNEKEANRHFNSINSNGGKYNDLLRRLFEWEEFLTGNNPQGANNRKADFIEQWLDENVDQAELKKIADAVGPNEMEASNSNTVTITLPTGAQVEVSKEKVREWQNPRPTRNNFEYRYRRSDGSKGTFPFNDSSSRGVQEFLKDTGKFNYRIIK